jgi:hypothetical protein
LQRCAAQHGVTAEDGSPDHSRYLMEQSASAPAPEVRRPARISPIKPGTAPNRTAQMHFWARCARRLSTVQGLANRDALTGDRCC